MIRVRIIYFFLILTSDEIYYTFSFPLIFFKKKNQLVFIRVAINKFFYGIR